MLQVNCYDNYDSPFINVDFKVAMLSWTCYVLEPKKENINWYDTHTVQLNKLNVFHLLSRWSKYVFVIIRNYITGIHDQMTITQNAA